MFRYTSITNTFPKIMKIDRGSPSRKFVEDAIMLMHVLYYNDPHSVLLFGLWSSHSRGKLPNSKEAVVNPVPKQLRIG